jgi:heme-degrading monooxygenase HmoA
MFQVLNCQFKRWIVAIALFGSIFTASPAYADAPVHLDRANDLVNVITIYPTTVKTQDAVLAEVSAAEKKTFSNVPGFQDSSILKAQDGSELVVLSQWKGKDLSSFQSYATEHILNVKTARQPQSFACQVQHTETRSAAPSFDENDVVMFSQFKMKPDKEQSELALIISQEMPGVLQMIPGLQWASMCPSTDQSTIALLARWQDREAFESLGQEPGFDKETNYWQTYADNEHGLFDVIKVIQ